MSRTCSPSVGSNASMAASPQGIDLAVGQLVKLRPGRASYRVPVFDLCGAVSFRVSGMSTFLRGSLTLSECLVSANTIERLDRTAEDFSQGTPACRAIGLHRPPVGTFVPGIVSRDGSVVGGRANCDGGGRRLVGSIVGSTGVKNASPWADLPPKAMSPFAVETRSPGRNVGSFFTPSGAKPKGSLPLQVQFATSSLR